jgi:hypothetical protein
VATAAVLATGMTGGGVSVSRNATFTKIGGIIYGKDEGANSNIVTSAYLDGGDGGIAVYYNASPAKYRDSTLCENNNLSTSDMSSGWNQ